MFLFLLSDEIQRNEFEELYNKYNKLVYVEAYRLLGNDHDSQEIVYETFYKIANSYDSLEKKELNLLKGYLVRICQNESINLLKKRKKEIPHDYAEKPYEDKNSYSRNPVNIITDKQCYERMKELISQLKPIYKDVFMLKAVHKMSYETISETMKISEETAKKRYQRARTQIAEQLEKEGYGRE